MATTARKTAVAPGGAIRRVLWGATRRHLGRYLVVAPWWWGVIISISLSNVLTVLSYVS